MLLLTIISMTAFSQFALNRHPSTLGIGVTLYDFKKKSTSKDVNTLNPGLSLTYLKGITNRLDIQADLTGSFPDSTAKNESSRDQLFLSQASTSIRFRFLNVRNVFQPFFLTGAGLSNHNNNLSSYILAGPGIEFRYKNIYLHFYGRYHFSLSKSLNNHFLYSIGIAGLISQPRKHRSKLIIANSIELPKALDGDNDGITDSIDRCPKVPGLSRFNGCPDTDGDGIPDYDDQCLTIPGTIKYHGCTTPDTDGDGTNEEQDHCLNFTGPKTNHGCPVIVKDMTDSINLAASNIFFKTGSFELLPYSFTALDNLVRILTENKTINLIIEGHTDNVGSQMNNQKLSENRAKTVAQYLSNKGIEKSRLKAIGFGREKPIATNDTEGGRAKNRRVALKAN